MWLDADLPNQKTVESLQIKCQMFHLPVWGSFEP